MFFFNIYVLGQDDQQNAIVGQSDQQNDKFGKKKSDPPSPTHTLAWTSRQPCTDSSYGLQDYYFVKKS